MAETFDDIVEKILEVEAGYVNDPADRGGETKYGISTAAHPDVDVQSLTGKKARSLYRRLWDESQAFEVAPFIRHLYFDMVVLHGQGNAVMILQKACRRSGHQIAVDALIGPQTIGASSWVIYEFVVLERAMFVNAIIGGDRSQGKFLHGWLNRVFSFTNDDTTE